MSSDKSLDVTISKSDADRGLVFGWAIVCKKDGEPYYDLQDDFIPEDTMLDASLEYMQNSRAAGEMHKSQDFSFGDKKVSGEVLYAFPMTEDVIKAFELESDRTGLMIGVHVTDQEALEKVKSGEYKGFSIEGKRLEQDILGDNGEVVKTDKFDIEKRRSAYEIEKSLPRALRGGPSKNPYGRARQIMNARGRKMGGHIGATRRLRREGVRGLGSPFMGTERAERLKDLMDRAGRKGSGDYYSGRRMGKAANSSYTDKHEDTVMQPKKKNPRLRMMKGLAQAYEIEKVSPALIQRAKNKLRERAEDAAGEAATPKGYRREFVRGADALERRYPRIMGARHGESFGKGLSDIIKLSPRLLGRAESRAEMQGRTKQRRLFTAGAVREMDRTYGRRKGGTVISFDDNVRAHLRRAAGPRKGKRARTAEMFGAAIRRGKDPSRRRFEAFRRREITPDSRARMRVRP